MRQKERMEYSSMCAVKKESEDWYKMDKLKLKDISQKPGTIFIAE
jgi:hypothetical protein